MTRSRRASLAAMASFGCLCAAPGLASAAVYRYVDWTAASASGGTASGTITLPDSSTVTVSFSAVNANNTAGTILGAQTSGGTNYWNPSAPYISTQVENPPPTPDIIQLVGGSQQTYKVMLSEPIKDPIMSIVSLGQPSVSTTYQFDAPFTIVSQGIGYWGGSATALAQLPNNVLRGNEGHGTIQFIGTFASFSWTVPTPENWHGFTFGIRTTPRLEPGTGGAGGAGGAGGVGGAGGSAGAGGTAGAGGIAGAGGVGGGAGAGGTAGSAGGTAGGGGSAGAAGAGGIGGGVTATGGRGGDNMPIGGTLGGGGVGGAVATGGGGGSAGVTGQAGAAGGATAGGTGGTTVAGTGGTSAGGSGTGGIVAVGTGGAAVPGTGGAKADGGTDAGSDAAKGGGGGGDDGCSCATGTDLTPGLGVLVLIGFALLFHRRRREARTGNSAE